MTFDTEKLQWAQKPMLSDEMVTVILPGLDVIARLA